MVTMADLLATQDRKRLSFSRGESISGKVSAITDSEVIVDLGAKSEGVLSKRDFSPEQLEALQVGSTLEAYVAIPENESGQIILTLYRQIGGKKSAEQLKHWQKFIAAFDRQATLAGKIIEANKGGLLVEVDKVRGFVPSSQTSLQSISSLPDSGELIGQQVQLKVIEVDPTNNRLVLSALMEVSEERKQRVETINVGDKASGRITAAVPFGLFVDLKGAEGILFAQEVSWSSSDSGGEVLQNFSVGQDIEAKVLSKDENSGRVMLSLRQLSEDPFVKLAESFQVDDVVSGTVKEVMEGGVLVLLEENVEGFVPSAKVEQGASYTPGQKVNFLVDSVDRAKRRINLAPFLTTTRGLIYK